MTIPTLPAPPSTETWFEGVCLGCIAENGDPNDPLLRLIAKEILEERSGVLQWLYGYFSTLRRPMNPREFFEFWSSLDMFEKNRFTMFAIHNMP